MDRRERGQLFREKQPIYIIDVKLILVILLSVYSVVFTALYYITLMLSLDVSYILLVNNRTKFTLRINFQAGKNGTVKTQDLYQNVLMSLAIHHKILCTDSFIR